MWPRKTWDFLEVLQKLFAVAAATWWLLWDEPVAREIPAILEVFSPCGTLAEAPYFIRWEGVEDAAFFRVAIQDRWRTRVIDRVIRDPSATRVVLTGDERRCIEIAGPLFLRVAAGGDDARLLASSRWIELEVMHPPRDPRE